MAGSHISRREFAAWAAGTAAMASPLAALAQGGYPNRPIRLLVGLAAGGSLDTIARAVARKMGDQGTQVIVDNKPGASMMLSAVEVKRAEPDGYTLLFAPSSVFAQNPHTLANVPYDPFKDFTPITMVARGPLVLTVHSSLPVHNVKELVAWAKANPGKLNFASFGTGTSSHIYAMTFARITGIQITHVPYKGTADAASDLLAGRVQAYFDAAPTAITNSQGGRIRMIGVAAPKRMAAAPEVPTFTEQGVPGMDLTSWVAIFGPAKMPKDLVAKVNAVIVKALNTQDLKDFVAKGAYEVAGSTPEEMAQEERVAYDKWGSMVKQIGFQKQ
jgi:tripartite-type tricarboxylate transporter receptor subunit TctC